MEETIVGAEEFITQIQPAGIEAIRQAGAYLSGALQQDVSHQCPVFHGGTGSHSPLGSIPFKETGLGQLSIGYEHMDDGVKVGVSTIEEPPPKTARGHGRSNPLDNHLFFWDQNGRPWLSNSLERHGDTLEKICMIVLKSKLGLT